MRASSLTKVIQILSLFFLVIAGLYFAKPFLVPLTLACIIAMLFVPLSLWMEKKGVSRGLSILFCILILVLVVAGIFTLLTWQVAGFTEDMSQMQKYVVELEKKLLHSISSQFGIAPKKLPEVMRSLKDCAFVINGRL